MINTMSTLACGACGAPLSVPREADALEAQCRFCGRRTLLPKDVREHRAPKPVVVVQHVQPTSFVMPIVLGLMFFGVLGLLVMFRASSPMSAPGPQRSLMREPSVAQASAPTWSVPKEIAAPQPVPAPPNLAAATQSAAIMKRLHTAGCKTVILAPTETSGAQTVESRFVMNGHCVTLVAVSGVTHNPLTLTIKNPLGEALSAPAPAPTLEFTVCPRMAGLHPTKIVPATQDAYTVAAIECPRPRGGK